MPSSKSSSWEFRWWARPPTEDTEQSGITFTDILFGFVLAEIFLRGRELDRIPGAGRAHLAVAMVLVTTSWIGYHNSKKGTRYRARFFNLPLLLFTLDMIMVFLYFLVAVNPDAPPAGVASIVPSAQMEANVVALVFLLYLLWDAAHAPMAATTTKYPGTKFSGARMAVTAVGLGVSTAVAVYVAYVDPSTTSGVVGVDLVLIAILIAYRWGKDGLQEKVVTNDGDGTPSQ